MVKSIKIKLTERLEELDVAANEYRSALVANSGIAVAMLDKTVDIVQEDSEVQDLVEILDVILNAKAQHDACAATPVVNNRSGSTTSTSATAIKVRLNTPKFSGKSRDFAIYKKEFMDIVVPGRSDAEIGALLREGLNTKEKNLLRNNDMANYKEALDILQNEYGKPELVINDVNAELDKLKPPTGEKADLGFVSFVEKVENICRDMETVQRSDDLKNGHMINVLVKKLPSKVAQDWAKHKHKEKLSSKDSNEIFQELMQFLKEEKEVTKDLLHKQEASTDKSRTHTSYVTGQTFVVNQPPKRDGGGKSGGKFPAKLDPLCIACKGTANSKEANHWTSNCEKWKALKLSERKKLVKCHRHIQAGGSHDSNRCQGDKMSKWYNNGVFSTECGICGSKQHCAELCEQNKAITKLHKISSMSVSTTPLPPVLLQASFIDTPHDGQLGALWDLCSTDDYITFRKAEEMNLEGRDVLLSIEGIRGSESTVKSKLYDVPVCFKSRKGKMKQVVFQCYGLDQIASSAAQPSKDSYDSLCDKFGVSPEQVRRPSDIDLLVSMRRNKFHPTPKATKGNMILYKGPFGQVFGGAEEGLDFEPYVLSAIVKARQRGCMTSNTFKSVVKSVTAVSSNSVDKKLLDFFEDDSIGVDANPKCGQCQCGGCIVGDKPMSLKMEKLYREFDENLEYKPEGLPGDPGPFFQTTYRWDIPREELLPNLPAVEATMKRTLRKLEKDPECYSIYDQQLQTLIDMGVARELEEGELAKWIDSGKNHHYTAHQMVDNPDNKTTPIRVVFNSSQKFKGQSLNSSWNLGPDVMSNLQIILLRFRRDVVGAQGDISKMFYAVRVSKEEEMMQLFIWKFKGESKVRTFCMTRLIMGNKPSTNISIVAVHKCTKLQDFETRLPEACEVLMKEIYVDNVLVVGPNDETVDKLINDVEEVAAAGGFKFKAWMRPKAGIQEDQVVSLDVYDDVEKALGVNWCLLKDEFFVKMKLSESDKKFFEDFGPAKMVKPKLTLQICLHFHAKIYDPLGLVMPTKMIGNLLFRSSLQFIKKEEKGRIPWGEILPDSLVDEWLSYLDMVKYLENVRFPRSIKPENADPNILPDLVTFEDGNPDSFGANAYARWTLKDSSIECRLIGSKAKLAPILSKSETVRNELNGATTSARHKVWISKNLGIKFGRHIPFLDSRIVQDMIKKDSYMYNTFAGVRVAEIQSKTNVDDWLHVPSAENISDILTRGAPPSELVEGSKWQNGPAWLSQDISTWPVTDISKAESVETEIAKFSTADKRLKAKAMVSSTGTEIDILKHVEDATAQSLFVNRSLSCPSKQLDLLELLGANDGRFSKLVARFSDLSKLIRVIAYVMRLALFSKRVGGPSAAGKGKVVTEITAQEYYDAWLVLIHLEQKVRLNEKHIVKLVPKKVTMKLSTYDWSVEHIVLGGRVSNFPVGFDGNKDIPVIPYGPLARLVMLYYHDKFHRDIDTIVTEARADVWVIKARKLATVWDVRCKICLIKRQKVASQVMGDLPVERTEIKPAWTSVNMDLFGPFLIRDDCVKRGPRVFKKVWGIIYVCTLTRGVYLDVCVDYGTESVLHTIRRLMNQKGDVKVVFSDPGTQLKGASKELSDWRKGWDLDKLVRFGAEKGIDWRFVMPNAQHQNGAVEIMVKMVKGVKKALLKSIGSHILSLNETYTLFSEVANLVNERPIGLKPNTNTHPEFLSPNSLFLGRCSSRISSGPFNAADAFTEDPKSFKTRFHLVQSITDQYWRNWTRLYFPTLLICHKWHSSQRNVSVNDIVLLQDDDAFRSEWRLGRVLEAYPDRRGNVRNVQVEVHPKQEGVGPYKPSKGIELNRHVSRLIVLVPVEDQEQSEDSQVASSEEAFSVASNVE